MQSINTLILTVFAALAMSACGGTTTYESYRPVKGAKTDIAYVNTTADFSQYRRLLVDEMGIFYPSHAPLSEQDLARVRMAFRTAFIAQLKDYEIVDKAGPDVMRVTASLVDLRHTAMGRLPNVSRDINDILQPGRLTFTIEMKDSRTDRVLLRAADTEKSPVIDLPEEGMARAVEVDAAAEYWAQLFRSFLDQNFGGH